MKNKRPSKFDKGGLYIALCCFALIAAVIGYAGNKEVTPSQDEAQKIKSDELASNSVYTPTKKSNIYDEVKVEVKDEVNQTSAPTVTEEKEAAASDTVLASNKQEFTEPVFKKPVDGKIIVDYSGETLVFNDILSDWRTHNGVDISCDKSAAIYASCDGVVSEVYETALGKTVRIDHQNGYETIYANLSDQIEVITGDKVKSGDLIGKIGESAVADFTTEPHLHFEIMQNNEYVNPQDYIK